VDDATADQIAELREHLEAKRRERAAHRKRLDALEVHAAKLGIETPAHVTNEITDLLVTVRERDTQIRELERQVTRLEAAPQSAISLPEYGSPIPELIPAVVDVRLQALKREIEMVLDLIAKLHEDVAESREESREWRAAERTARQEGQRDYRLLFAGIVLGLAILAVVVVLIAIQVY
jgi:hypothetical protein